MFLVYNVINHCQALLRYYLLAKSQKWTETHTLINQIPLHQFETAAAELKITGKCMDPDIIKLEQQVQIVAAKTLHSFSRYAK